MCPAIILAKSLKLRLIGLTRYDITSMGINIGNKAIGTPLGTKNLRKLIPCFARPINVTPKNIKPAKPNVTII